MKKKFTLIKIAFFSLLLACFIFIQYSWLKSLQKEKLQEYRSFIISGIVDAGYEIAHTGLRHDSTAAITTIIQHSFSAKELGNIRFEFSISSGNRYFTSPGFNQEMLNDSNNLMCHYDFLPQNEQKGNLDSLIAMSPFLNELASDSLTVIVPLWKKIARKEMTWPIAASGFLTIIILVIFWYAYILGERRQQLFYNKKTNVIKNVMQQLETPLSTVSVAAEALRNAQVMSDSVKTNYYQQIINEENQRMNEQVKKFVEDLK